MKATNSMEKGMEKEHFTIKMEVAMRDNGNLTR